MFWRKSAGILEEHITPLTKTYLRIIKQWIYVYSKKSTLISSDKWEGERDWEGEGDGLKDKAVLVGVGWVWVENAPTIEWSGRESETHHNYAIPTSFDLWPSKPLPPGFLSCYLFLTFLPPSTFNTFFFLLYICVCVSEELTNVDRKHQVLIGSAIFVDRIWVASAKQGNEATLGFQKMDS